MVQKQEIMDSVLYLCEAEFILEDLKSKQSDSLALQKILADETWKILFKLGCILPNAVINSEKEKEKQLAVLYKTHFRDVLKDGKHYFHYPSTKLFLWKYTIDISRPLEFGYYVHLYLDQKIKKRFYKKYYILLKEDGCKKCHFDRGDIVYIQSVGSNNAQKQFFSVSDLERNLNAIGCSFEKMIELDNLNQWLENKSNQDFIKCIIEEVNGYDLVQILSKEVKKCKADIKEYNKRPYNNTGLLQLSSNIGIFLKECSSNISEQVKEALKRGEQVEKKGLLGIIKLFYPIKRLLSLFLDKFILGLYRFFRKKSIVQGILYFGKKLFGAIFSIFIWKQKVKKKTVNDEIYEKWKIKWKEERYYKEDYFYPLFIENYNYISGKIAHNRKMNFRTKKAFIATIMIFPLSIMFILGLKGIVGFYDFIDSQDKVEKIKEFLNAFSADLNLENVVSSGALLIIFVILASIIAKWVDIKKYQETWVRHEDHKYKLDREMFKYVQEINPYSGSKKQVIFVDNVLKIWNENQEKFIRNMEEREKPLTDILEYLKES